MSLTMNPETECYDPEPEDLTDEGKIELIQDFANQTQRLVATLDRPALDDDIRVQAIKALVVHVRTLRYMAIDAVEGK